MVEIYKLPGTLINLVSAIEWAELNAQGGTISFYANQAIVAGASISSTAISTSAYHSGHFFIKNLGASTNFAVEIFSSDDAVGTIKTPLISAVLNTTVTERGEPVSALPPYIFIDVYNLDPSNSTTFTIELTL